MKQIIEGRRYDTETAKEIGCTSSNVGPRDFHWWRETLYLKRTGEFFLHGEGGPASRYSKAVGMNEWTGGARIMPMKLDEARKWAEENLSVEEYEGTFGEVEETGEKKVATFSLNLSTIDKITQLAGFWGCSKSEVVDRLVAKNA